MYAFLHTALIQTRDYCRSNYTCTYFLSYDMPVHTWNKWSLDIKHETSGNGGRYTGLREREGGRERERDRESESSSMTNTLKKMMMNHDYLPLMYHKTKTSDNNPFMTSLQFLLNTEAVWSSSHCCGLLTQTWWPSRPFCVGNGKQRKQTECKMWTFITFNKAWHHTIYPNNVPSILLNITNEHPPKKKSCQK